LLSENNSLTEEVRGAQENIRLSSLQTNKLTMELNEIRNRLGSSSQESETYKQRIQKLVA
jgi:hypothetical protein